MTSPKSAESLNKLQRRQHQETPKKPRFWVRFSKNLVEAFEGSRLYLVGECWFSKGYWILLHRHEGHLYRIWTATREIKEVRAWIRWFHSEAFRREHQASIQTQTPFWSHPKPPADGVWLGWRRAILRPRPGEVLPDHIDFANTTSRLGWIFQRYSPEAVADYLQKRQKPFSLYYFCDVHRKSRRWDSNRK